MKVERNPLQIILIEQVLYAVYISIFLVAYIYYMPRVLVDQLWLSPEVFGFLYVGVILLLVIGWSYLWLPYTSVKIWRSAEVRLKGIWLYISKFYAAFIILITIYSGVTGLPDFINWLSSQF